MAAGTAANPITLDDMFAVAHLQQAADETKASLGTQWEAGHIKHITDYARDHSLAATSRWWACMYPPKKASLMEAAANAKARLALYDIDI